jgi:hypothetical protein
MRVSLNAKVDDQFFDQLSEKIKALGGTIVDTAWNLGPAIQTTTYLITLPQGQLTAQEDTEGRFYIEGDGELVSFLILQLPPHLSFQPTSSGETEI